MDKKLVVDLLKLQYEQLLAVSNEVEEQSKLLDNFAYAVFEDFFGISKSYKIVEIMVEKMDKLINLFFCCNDCNSDYMIDVFSYFWYETRSMKDGGFIKTSVGKEYKIVDFEDVLVYLFGEYELRH